MILTTMLTTMLTTIYIDNNLENDLDNNRENNRDNNIYLGYCLGGLGLRPGGPGVSGWAPRATSAQVHLIQVLDSVDLDLESGLSRGFLSGVHQVHIPLL